MLTLLERNVAAIEHRLVLLAPARTKVPGFFNRLTVDAAQHTKLVREMQRLRGAVYLDDGAVERRQLSSQGLHRTADDERSWHLLIRNAQGQISSCVWYLEHENATSVHHLRARKCPLGQHATLRDTFEGAVKSELDRARRDRLRYAEVGGWAVAKASRCTAEGLILALAAYSLGRAFGGALGLTTATVRHSSSTILRRLGGSHLQADGRAVPSYYDPHYRCEMELLRFDSRKPNIKYAGLIERIHSRLANVPVFASQPAPVRQSAHPMPIPERPETFWPAAVA